MPGLDSLANSHYSLEIIPRAEAVRAVEEIRGDTFAPQYFSEGRVMHVDLGDALRNYRLKQGLLQKQMACKLDMSREYYNKMEAGRVIPSGTMLKRVLELTGISLEFSLARSAGPRPLNRKVEGPPPLFLCHG